MLAQSSFHIRAALGIIGGKVATVKSNYVIFKEFKIKPLVTILIWPTEIHTVRRTMNSF